MMPFDLNKCPKNEQGHWLAQTRDGRKVRIVCADARSSHPIVGVVGAPNGNEAVHCWHKDGRWNDHGDVLDLINPPTKREAVVEIWTHPTRGARALLNNGQLDDIGTSWRRVHQQKIEWEE
jgi:hypothetical protein